MKSKYKADDGRPIVYVGLAEDPSPYKTVVARFKTAKGWYEVKRFPKMDTDFPPFGGVSRLVKTLINCGLTDVEVRGTSEKVNGVEAKYNEFFLHRVEGHLQRMRGK